MTRKEAYTNALTALYFLRYGNEPKDIIFGKNTRNPDKKFGRIRVEILHPDGSKRPKRAMIGDDYEPIALSMVGDLHDEIEREDEDEDDDTDD